MHKDDMVKNELSLFSAYTDSIFNYPFSKILLLLKLITQVCFVENLQFGTKSCPIFFNPIYLFHRWAIVLFIILFGSQANAQVTVDGSTGANGTYTELRLAFDAINGTSQTGNTITITLTTSTAETASALLNAGSWSTLVIYPTVSGITISGNLGSPLIDLNGADNVTIDGRVNATNSTKDLVLVNTSTSSSGGTSTIRLYNGANNNTIKYCTIKGSSTDGSGGIIFLSATAASTGNTIDNNNITNAADANRPINAIYSGGAANTVTISNNYIYDFLSRSSSSNGINLNSSTGASTISGNSFYETNTFNPTGNRAYYFPIYISSSSSGFTVSGNYIGGNAPLCSGTWIKSNTAFSNLIAIYLNSVGTGTPSMVKGNTINGFNWSNNNNDNTWMFGISINAGDVTLGASGEPNTIGSITGTPNMSFTYDRNGNIFVPINLSGSGYITCQYNNIGGITCNNTYSTEVTRIYCIYRGNNNVSAIISNNTIGSSTNPVTLTSPATGDVQYLIGICNSGSATSGITINNNTISYLNNQATGTFAGYVAGILSYDAAAPLTISNNSVHDLTISNENGGGGRDASMRGGIWVTTAYQLTVTNNTVYNLINTNSTFNGYMYGIYATGGGTSITNDCSGNTVYNISATGTSAGPFIYGIYFNSYSSSINTVARNYIYGLSCAGVAGNYNNTRYYGIYKPSSAHTITYANNIISLGNTNISNIYGIYQEGVAGYASNVYFNTIYISGTPTVGNLISYALYSTGNDTRSIKNNILYNARSNNGAVGNHFCIAYGSSAAASDYNDMYAPGTSGCIGYFNGNAYTTLVSWRTLTGTEANSLNTNPNFASAGGTAATDYIPSTTTLVAVTGTGITTDYDGGADRSLTYPAIGAFEYAVSACSNPSSGGTITSSQTLCAGFVPAAFTSTVAPGGHTGTLEYKWQKSTSSGSEGFSDITSSNSVTYAPGALGATTWYKRLSKVTCDADWAASGVSNVLEITVNQPSFTPGTFTVADLQASGTAIKWYTTETGGTSLASGATISNGTTYYASQTVNEVESTARFPVTATILQTPCAPTGLATQTGNSGQTLADLTVTGSNIRWYSASSGGDLLPSSTLLGNNVTYYASQTINCSESATRLGVVVTIIN